MGMKVRDAAHEAEAHFAQGRVTLKTPEGTTTFDAEHVGGPQWVLSSGATRHVAFVAKDRSGTWVHVDGRAFLVQRAERGAGGAGGASDGTVVAPMTGKVLETCVAAGDAVTEGQVLLVLSAMKMRLEIRAPRAGRVARLNCEAGAQVEGGSILAVVESA